MQVKYDTVECRAEWVSTSVAEFALAALMPVEIEVHTGLLEGEALFVAKQRAGLDE